ERHRLVSPVDLRHNMGMSNRAIEFHDSTFDGVEKDGTNGTLRFSAAYIHESDGKPALDAGSGWSQEARLHIAGASLSGEIPELPRDLWDGSIRLGDELYQMIPIPLDHSLHRHYVPDLVVDAFWPELSFRWRRASTFCKAPLKKSTSSVLSASNRFNWWPPCGVWIPLSSGGAILPSVQLGPFDPATCTAAVGAHPVLAR